ncbi:MAG: 4-hydroxybutyryl-CoA dehydratase [Nitrospinota bacterium]|nr:MAG: 4-hydroxybutyryl-CoA dehydratase [Nitrospinota bacterium]
MIRDGASYLNALQDGRVVYYRGKRVSDVVKHPVLGVTARHTAQLYDFHRQEFSPPLVVRERESGEEISAFYQPPLQEDELRGRGELIYQTTRQSRAVFNIVKVVGSDALFALLIATRQMDEKLGTSYHERVKRYLQHVAHGDIATVTAQTDVKGDRSLRPHQQADPDLYVRIKERRQDGIVVSGAKVHITQAPVAEEILVIPCRAMTEQDTDYAVAFAVPAHAPGLKMICRPLLEVEGAQHPLEGPRVLHNALIEALLVFDDVFIPWERVFLCGETFYAGVVANTFALWHRYSAIRYRSAQADMILGLALELAEANGVVSKGHIRRNLTALILFAEMQRMGAEMAALRATVDAGTGIVCPNPIYTNLGKLYSNAHYLEAVQALVDCAGGLAVTAPGGEDYTNPETREYVRKYLAGNTRVESEKRFKLFLLARELVGLLGGLETVTMIHAEGSIEASVIELLRSYDFRPMRECVDQLVD